MIGRNLTWYFGGLVALLLQTNIAASSSIYL